MHRAEPMQRCKLDECRAACCLHGVWVDLVEVREILAQARLIKAHLPHERRNPQEWFEGRQETDQYSLSGEVRHTTVVEDASHYGGTACIFLRDDHKCALQTAGEAAEARPWGFKPFYCILHPLTLDEEGRITLDETHLLLNEPASCLRPADEPIPLEETFAPELEHLIDGKK